ncbi:MAG: hypothetical protein IJI23_04205 [Lachnospiraceae bacterium]|nr:hypothetical protein [Lachnospiraceae bacterium]
MLFKMRMTKRTAEAVLALIMLFSVALTGCGGKADLKQDNAAKADASGSGQDDEMSVSADTKANSLTISADANKTDDNKIRHFINNEGYVITVDVNHDDYATAQDPVNAPEKYNGDMRADCIMSSFTAEHGAKELNHPNGLATDGTHFVLCDTWNNRVLVWNSIPTCNVQADVVLGQKDFTTFSPGYGTDQVSWPVGVTFAGERLIVSDANNNRLLVWDSVPTENGTPADHVITAMTPQSDLNWPWETWSDGSRLIATSTNTGEVAFWNDVDSAISGGYADYVIKTGGTPRTIICDGDYLLIGDHNMGWDGKYDYGNQGAHVWMHYPTEDKQADFKIDLQIAGTIIDGDLYAVAFNDESMHIYDGLIDNEEEKSAVTLGTDMEYFRPGDNSTMLYVDGRTYAVYYNSGLVAIYDGKITKDNYMSPIGFIGADENVRSMSVLRGEYQNPNPETNGTSLVFIDDFNGLIGIYKTYPDSENAIPDYLYHFPPEWDTPIDVAIDKYGRMLVLTDSSLLIWNQVPLNGELYDKRIEFEHCIGRNSSKVVGCDEGFILYSQVDKKLYKLPLSEAAESFDNAITQTDAAYISDLNTDGTYLTAASEEDRRVYVYNVSDLSLYGEVYSDASRPHKPGDHPDFEVVRGSILLPNGQFLAADQNEIRIWDSLDAAIADREFSNYDVMGALDNYPVLTKENGVLRDASHSVATDGSIFKPTYMTYSRGHLWVGEYKFSSRLLRYDIKYDSEKEAVANISDDDNEITEGSPEYDKLVSETIGFNADITLSSNAKAMIDTSILKEFTIDCAGHDIKIAGRINLSEVSNKALNIVNPGRVDLGELEFYKSPNISVAGDTDYLLIIKGENLDITTPDGVPAGSRKERTKGFYCETKDSVISIRYGGQ